MWIKNVWMRGVEDKEHVDERRVDEEMVDKEHVGEGRVDEEVVDKEHVDEGQMDAG